MTDTSSKVLLNMQSQTEIACNECDEMFKTDEDLQEHITANHRGLECACNICGNILPSRQALEEHLAWNHSHDGFACEFCEKKFPQQRELHTHIEHNHVFVESCDDEGNASSFATSSQSEPMESTTNPSL